MIILLKQKSFEAYSNLDKDVKSLLNDDSYFDQIDKMRLYSWDSWAMIPSKKH